MSTRTCRAWKHCLVLWALKRNMPISMSKFEIPMQVAEQVAQLGQRVRIARIRRGWSVADLASKAGINRNTLTALELGKPGTAVGVCFTVLWALGLDRTLNGVADPDADLHGKALEAARRPTRAGKPRKTSDDYDF
jgi:DNA-binding XRE family transcriptional regulator